jgi:hypothetical protein
MRDDYPKRTEVPEYTEDQYICKSAQSWSGLCFIGRGCTNDQRKDETDQYASRITWLRTFFHTQARGLAPNFVLLALPLRGQYGV